MSDWVRIVQWVRAGTSVLMVGLVFQWLTVHVLTQVGVGSGQCLSDWVRIVQWVRAGTSVLMVNSTNPGGDGAWPVFV